MKGVILYWSWWCDWSSWVIGVRFGWRRWMRVVTAEIGPIGLCLEIELASDALPEAKEAQE